MPFAKPRTALRSALIACSLIGSALVGLHYADSPGTPVATQIALPPAPAPVAYEPVERDPFGFNVARYDVSTYRVQRGDTYAALLSTWGVDPAARLPFQDALVQRAEAGLRAGRTLRLYRTDGRLEQIAFELDGEHYLIADVSRADVRSYRRPSTIVQRQVTARIEGSLYETLQNADAPVELANLLAEAFETKIDFHRLQPGDKVTVVFEERQVEGKAVDVTRLNAVEMEHGGALYDGYWFEGEESIGYYNGRGESLSGGFLKSPVPFSRLTSGYTKRRFHPVQKRWKAHLGTDYAAPHGTPILAVGDGVVTRASRTRGNGNYVKIRHTGTYQTQYLHMSRFAEGIRPGTRVVQGQTIGYVGATGLATGPHVCFRFWKNGVQVDHRVEAGPPPEPVADVDREAFDALVAGLKPMLEDRPVVEEFAQPIFLFDAHARPAI
jgi:murein DD-endopeptidase MepM/ murein hydrolase activator NlpD